MKHVNKCLTSRKVGGGVGKVNNWFLLTGVSLKAILYMAFWRQYYETLSQSLFNIYCWLLFKTFVPGFCFSVLIISIVIVVPGRISPVLYLPSLHHSRFVPTFSRCLIHLLIGLAVESVGQPPSVSFSYQHGNNSKTFKTVLRFVKKHLQKVYINDK